MAKTVRGAYIGIRYLADQCALNRRSGTAVTLVDTARSRAPTTAYITKISQRNASL